MGCNPREQVETRSPIALSSQEEGVAQSCLHAYSDMVGTMGAWKGTAYNYVSSTIPLPPVSISVISHPILANDLERIIFNFAFSPHFFCSSGYCHLYPSVMASLWLCPFQDSPQSKLVNTVDLLVSLVPLFGTLQTSVVRLPTSFPRFQEKLCPLSLSWECQNSLPLLEIPRVGSILAFASFQNFTHLDKFRHTLSDTWNPETEGSLMKAWPTQPASSRIFAF